MFDSQACILASNAATGSGSGNVSILHIFYTLRLMIDSFLCVFKTYLRIDDLSPHLDDLLRFLNHTYA